VRSSKLRRTVTLACALGLGLALPPGAQAGFDAPITVTGSGGDPFGYPSDVGFDRAGVTTVETVSRGSVMVFTRPRGGSFSGGAIGSGTKASMAVSANGTAVTVWRESATTVRTAYRAGSGGAFTPAASFPGAAVGNVAAGIDAGGNAVVAWKDGGIHYALSTGRSFGPAQAAPLGASPSFDGRGSDPQRDHGPRAFRDNAGNVLLAYRDGTNATVAHRAPAGTWGTAILPGGASTDLQADADPTSQRLIVGYTTTGRFRAFEGSTSSTTGTIRVDQPVSSDVISVAVRRGGAEDLTLWRDPTGAMRSASCLENFAPATVAPSGGVLGGAITSGSDQIAFVNTAPGVQRASRRPGGAWTSTPFTVSNYGTFALGAGYNGDALGLFVDFPNDTAITGLPYSGVATSSARCAGPSPPPVLGKAVNVALVSGRVTVRVPGRRGRFVALRGIRHVPVGSLLDTRRGTVQLSSAATTRGLVQSGDFSAGVFQVKQARHGGGLTDLNLSGGSFRGCAVGASRRPVAARSSRAVRRLRGNAHGRFRTRGRYSAATVRGTKWETTDRCDGTLTRVTRGVVVVRDLRRRRNVTVRAGHSYLARAG
jgi:hypothetical protein